jgi:hypothetical protein
MQYGSCGAGIQQDEVNPQFLILPGALIPIDAKEDCGHEPANG